MMTTPTLQAQRRALRQRVRSIRREITHETRKRADLDAQLRVIKHSRFQKANRVALYQSYDGEVSTEMIADECIRLGKQALYAKTTPDGRLEFIKPNGWSKTRFGLPVPTGEAVVLDADDLIIVPGIAFDPLGNRLGFGGGWYDRTLSVELAWPMGLAYHAQVIERLPAEDWDIPVRTLITESMVHEVEHREHPQWTFLSDSQSA